MSLPHPWLLTLCVAALLLLLGATSGLVNSRLSVSEPLVCAAAGVLLGPYVLHLVVLDPAHDAAGRAFLREAARVTLAIAVLAAAIRLPQGWLRRHWSGLAVALIPGTFLMFAAGTLVSAATLRLHLLTCVLVGAIVAPTDPVLSAPVVSGALAERAVPGDLRHAINAESGANDGLAQPFVLLPIALMAARPGEAGAGLAAWAWHALAWEVGSAVVVGAAAGWLACKCMRWAARQTDADRASLLSIALALALVTLAALQAIGSDGVLGCFVAGATLNEAYDEDYVQHQEHFNEAISRFFDLPIMFLLGAAAPWQAWIGMGWHAAAFVAGILLLRRIPAWLLLGRLMPWTRRPSLALFAGWFGPIGAAAMFYACQAQDMTGDANLWPVVSLAAAASVVAHGVTGTHLSLRLGRLRRRLEASAADRPAPDAQAP
ncbi:MAG: cation:proton antiporter [Rhodospirillales bacterium]|nr:cation:proton antiporter [Rhodospirillales bacterium]